MTTKNNNKKRAEQDSDVTDIVAERAGKLLKAFGFKRVSIMRADGTVEVLEGAE